MVILYCSKIWLFWQFQRNTYFWKILLESMIERVKKVSGWSCVRLWYWWRGCCSGAVSLLTWRMTGPGRVSAPWWGQHQTRSGIHHHHHHPPNTSSVSSKHRHLCNMPRLQAAGALLLPVDDFFYHFWTFYFTISSFFIVQNVEIWLRSWMINVQNNPIKK